MFSLRLEDGTKIAGLHYKPSIGSRIRIDDIDKWFKVTRVDGRIAYSINWFDERVNPF